MKKTIILIIGLFCFKIFTIAQFSIVNNQPVFALQDSTMICPPVEGLWSISTKWSNNWMDEWKHADPQKIDQSGEWTILEGELPLLQGTMRLRDSYRDKGDGLIQCIRRFEWTGKDTLKYATLSVRWQVKGRQLQAFLPGILYYGNKKGAQINAKNVPSYQGTKGEFAIFEEHRYPMPFAMLENAEDKYAVAIHTTPSPVQGAVVNDQWWSLGVEASDEYSEIVLYSGPIGYNKQHSVAKALQQMPMPYGDTYLHLEPGQIIEKEFFIQLYPIKNKGCGFQQPVYTSLDLHKPYFSEQFDDMQKIIEGKYRFAQKRWIGENGICGFGMYEQDVRKELVMGWCGQAASCGYALQLLQDRLNDPSITDKIQRSLDFLTTFPIEKDGMFSVRYNISDKKYIGNGDHVSCGQAMYNFAKAIETAKQNKKFNTVKWEAFLQKICDGQSKRILQDNWNPKSTAEAFYIAPLVIASRLFQNNTYEKAAIKAGDLFAKRHLKMDECYWGGTLDAKCEDKEGAWAAFQGFLELYEHSKDEKYLSWAKHAMDVCLSYVVVWDIPLPPGRMADYNFKSTGWTVVSPQNQHIDVYGVLFAPEIYKMGKYLNDERLKRLAPVMYRSCYQLTDPFGSQGEQLQQTNFAQRGDMSNIYKLRGGYAEKWTVFWITAHFLNAAARFKEAGYSF